MDRTFLYRHRDLLALIHATEREPATHNPAGAAPVSRASLQADLANALARNTRLATRIQQLEKRLSVVLGEQLWRESGLCAPNDVEQLQRTITAWNSKPWICGRRWRNARPNWRLPGLPTGSWPEH
ncbi:hypothetical protein AB0B12_40725 [Streptomyces sp. NPDC044780]|uniref:hypothetical protein n=1 Tax=unclassified Streptomyces TaxID=2593676 RepID=UPI0033C05322